MPPWAAHRIAAASVDSGTKKNGAVASAVLVILKW
jgi:hypothetical protein